MTNGVARLPMASPEYGPGRVDLPNHEVLSRCPSATPRELMTSQLDEIYERYLRKAITEINRLSHEVAQAADGAPTALPTGHPLASIFLLKYGPQAQELQEGVAFHGRAGNALIKSLQRLHVDPMEVYGTNCVKFAGCDLAVAGEWLRRELRIVEPKLVVVMGDDALKFLNGIDF